MLTNQWRPRTEWTREWDYEYDSGNYYIIEKITGTVYELKTKARTYAWYTPTGRTYENIGKWVPITLVKKARKLLLNRNQLGGIVPPKKPTRTDLQNKMQGWAVSDGLVKQDLGTYGWVTANQTEIQEQNMGLVEGIPGNMTSFWAEAQGITDLVHTAAVDNKTKIFLDNVSVIDKVNQTYPLHPMQPEWELLEPTRRQVETRQLNISHVRGHQDVSDPRTPWEAHLNHAADRLAEQAHQHRDNLGYLPPGYTLRLHIDGTPVTTRIVGEIHRAATTPDLRDYYIRRKGWTDEIIASIDWDGQTKALESFTQSKQRTLHKYIHGWLLTGDHMQRRYGGTGTCPHCEQLETAEHLTRCKSEVQRRDIFLDTLTEKMRTLHTDQGLMQMIINYLSDRQGKLKKVRIDNETWVRQLQYEQTQIGIKQMWSGFLTQTWGDIQAKIYRADNRQRHCTGNK